MATSHQDKWNKLKKVPGLRSKMAGHYKDTVDNRRYITRLFNKYEEVIRNPKLFQMVRVRSKESKKAIPLGEGNVRFIPKAEKQKAFVKRGKVYREQTDTLGVYPDGSPKGYITKRYEQLIGPGDDPIPKLLDLLASGKRIEGKLYGQITGRPFLMNRIETKGDMNPIRGAVNYINNWTPQGRTKDEDGNHKSMLESRDDLLQELSILTVKIVRY